MKFKSLSSEEKNHLIFFCTYVLIFLFNDISEIIYFVVSDEERTQKSFIGKVIGIIVLFLLGFLMIILLRFKFINLTSKYLDYFKPCSCLVLLIFYCEFELLDKTVIWDQFAFGLLIGMFLLHSVLNSNFDNRSLLMFFIEMIYLSLRMQFVSGLHLQKIFTITICLTMTFKFQKFQEKNLPKFQNKAETYSLRKPDSILLKMLKQINSEGILILDNKKECFFINEKMLSLLENPIDVQSKMMEIELKYMPTASEKNYENDERFGSQSRLNIFLHENPKTTLREIFNEISHYLTISNCEDKEQFRETNLQFQIVQKERFTPPEEYFVDKLNLTIFWKKQEMKASLIQIPIVFDSVSMLNKEKQNQNKRIYSVSHEMRTPLNCIVSMLQILKPLLSHDIDEEYVNPAIISCNFLLYLVQDLLDMAQMESDKFTMNYDEFDPRILISDIIELFRIQASSKNTKIYPNISKNVPDTIISDHRRIRQILINLIGNALKFIKKVDGQIVIEVSVDPVNTSHLTIAVRDNGIGIKDEDKRNLFQAFGKINNEENKKMNATGVGLGLMISSNLAMNLHPKKSEGLRVDSQYGNGTTFSFVIEDKTEVSNVRDYTSAGNLLEKYQKLLSQKEKIKLIRKKTLSPFERDLLYLSGKDDSFTKKTYSSMKVSLSKKANTHYYQLTPLLRDNHSINIKEHNEKVKLMRKSLKIQKVQTEKKGAQPSLHSFCDVFIGTTYEDYDYSDTKMIIMKELNPMKPCQCPDILVVDDNAFNIYSLRKQLESFNFKIDSANDGEEAVKQVADFKSTYQCCHCYQAIFMDLEMPGKNGYQASKEIREFFKQNGDDYDVKIIACSAHLNEEIPDLHKSYGMDEFVTKPIIKGRLVVLLAKILNIMYDFNEDNE